MSQSQLFPTRLFIKRCLGLGMGAVLAITTAQAQLTPLFEYRFPASYDGLAADDGAPVTDQSPTATHATAFARTAGEILALSYDVPLGAPEGAQSLDLGLVNGRVATDATNLLSREEIAAHGGFTWDFWFKGLPEGTSTSRTTQKIMDNGGYEFVGVSNFDGDTDGKPGELWVRLSTTGNSWSLDEDDGLKLEDWNHVLFIFTVTDAGNLAALAGDVTIVLNGVVRSFPNVAMSNGSATIDPPRSLAIGKHPAPAFSEYYTGLVYNPSVYYGVPTIEVPVVSLLAGDANGFTATIKDGSLSPVDEDSLVVGLNGTPLATGVSVSRSGDLLTIEYAPPAPLAGGLQEVTLAFENEAGAAYEHELSFTVPGSEFRPILRYEFPASYAGDGENDLVEDLSPAGNDGTAISRSGLPVLSEDIPPGQPAATRSLSLVEFDGGLRTEATQLLNNTGIIAAGGFTMDVWLKGIPESTASTLQKVIDYAGTHFIAVTGYDHDTDGSPGEIVIRLGSAGSLYRLDEDDGLNRDGWNHVTATFTLTNYSNPNTLVGNVTLTLNGQVSTFTNRNVENQGDALNRPLAVGAHPDSGNERFRGLVYAPAVSFGVAPADEPILSLQASRATGLAVTLADSAGAAVNPATLKVELDGAALAVTPETSAGELSFTHEPAIPFTAGRHRLAVRFQDAEGKTYHHTRAFSILGAAFAPVFEYRFPESYDGVTPAGVVTDLSEAGHHAKANGPDADTPLALSEEVPPDAPEGSRSLDFATTSGNIITDHLSLLNRPLVIAHGGFTVELWFKGLSTGIQKVFDYAGTENIRTTGLVEGDDDAGVVQLNISNGTVLPLGVEQGLQVTGWNHLVVTYEVQDELDPARLQGRLAATLNGVVSSLESAVLTAYGDTFDRPIGIGSHPTGGERYTGLVYNPSLSYGLRSTPPADEPSLTFTREGDSLILTFEGVLEASATLTGFAEVEGATSPYTVPLDTAPVRFFRAVAPAP